MPFRMILLISTAASCLIFLGCTAATPQWRIDQNASLYESLSADHKALASKGKVAPGMSQSAVYLALGTPTRKIRGHRSDAPFERWEYLRRQPHLHHSFYAYQGLSFGRHSSAFGSFGVAPSIHYLPSHSGSVTFREGVVESWEFSNPRPRSY